MLIILPDEDGNFFIESQFTFFYNTVASFPARAVNGVHNVVPVLNKRIRNRNPILHYV
jgi:hypothetical protein